MKGREGFAPLFVVLLLALLLVPPHAAASAPSSSPSSNLSPSTFGVTATQSSTAANTFLSTLVLWHNSTSVNQSVPHLFPVNVTGYTSLTGFTAVLTVSSGTYAPILNVSQGASALLNGSITGQAQFNPSPGTTQLSVKLLQLFTVAGLAVPVGTYTVWANDSESGGYTRTLASLWTLSSTIFTFSYTLTAPADFYLNASTVFVPFPAGVTVNGTSVAVTNATSYQAQAGGVYLNNETLAPGKSVKMTVKFEPVPITSGPAALITLSTPKLVAGTTTTYEGTATWTNTGTLPFEGVYAISIKGFDYPIDPSSVKVDVNGVALASSGYTLQSTTLVIIPGVLLVGAQASVYFDVKFSSLQVPPEASLTSAGGYSVAGPFTVNDLLLTGFVLVAVYMLYNAILADQRRKRDEPAAVRRPIVNAIAVTLLLVGLYVVMNVHSL